MLKDNENFKWDAFISHATEDKEDLVLPLYKSLSNKGMKIWIDTHEICLGDSLRRKIDEGLRFSRLGIVILSKNFLQKEWTNKELDALVSKEKFDKKVILPIWHRIDKTTISNYSPLLSDKYAISSEIGLKKMTDQILRAFRIELKKDQVLISTEEIKSLIQAIKFTKSREGSYRFDIELDEILMKFQNNIVNLLDFNSKETEVILHYLNENINYIHNYDYGALSNSSSIEYKQKILKPLSNLRERILNLKKS